MIFNIKEKISILGAGSWGTTLAILLSKNSDVLLWSPFKEDVEEIIKNRENKIFLPSIKIPENINISSNLNLALNRDIIIIAIPMEYLRNILKKIRKINISLKNKVFLSVIKGIEIKSLKTASQIITEELNISKKQIAVLSGPTIAREIALGMPAVANIASSFYPNALRLQKLFYNTNLRIYTNRDIRGIEIAGALKNIIAIASGISDGLGFGTNAKSALICRGLKEILRFANFFKIKEKVFFGISGIGDLCTTCFSQFSRNRYVGEMVGKGKKLKDILKDMKMVAEGVPTTKAVYKIAKKYKIDMPITSQVYAILYKDKNPKLALKDLMSRPLKEE